jgi:Gpi18-like mannosyltransferase
MLPDTSSSVYPTRSHWLLYLLLFTLLILLTPKAGHLTDVACWVAWATHMDAYGLTRGYEVDTNNYNPLYQYVLFGFGRLFHGADHIYRYRHLLKIVTLVFDFWGAIWAVRFFGWGDGNQRFLLSLLFLLNIGYMYDTVAWEQVDAILATLAFAAIVQALRRRVLSSMVLFLLTVNMKSQGIIFLPPLLLLWAPQWWLAPRRLVQGALLVGAVQLLILLPYILAGNVMTIFHLVYDAVGYFPVASMNCFNMWAMLLHPYGVPDFTVWAGLTYKQWGLLSFLLASTVVLLPLGLRALQKLRTRATFGPDDYALVLLSLGMVPVVFCFFNTQMHERYWHPALILLGSYAILRQRYVLFCLFSAAYFLNLEAAFSFQLPPDKVHTTVLFWPEVVASLFAVVLVGGIWQLYRHEAGLRATWQQLRQPAVPAAVASAA